MVDSNTPIAPDAGIPPVRDVPGGRAALIDAIEGAGLPGAADGQSTDLVKVGSGGLSFELVLNGTTIRLDGQDVNTLGEDEFEEFLQRQKQAVDAGELDDQIGAALAGDGPHKATARVRSVGDQPR